MGSDLSILGASGDFQLGFSVACGDVNGDSLADLVLGTYDPSGPGKAYVFLGPDLPRGQFDLESDSPSLIFLGGSADDSLGEAVGIADFNGDGIGEILLGAPGADNGGRANCGAVYVFEGGPGLPTGITVDLSSGSPSLSPLSIIYGPQASDYLGGAITAVNFNGDIYEDICVTAENGAGGKGSSFVVAGVAAPPSSIDLSSSSLRLVTLLNKDPYDGVGMTVAAGNVNGDGFEDLIVGTSFAGPTFFEAFKGRVSVVFGQGSGQRIIDLSSANPDLTFFGANEEDALGEGVAAGDINGDGIDDLLLGATSVAGDDTDPGVVHVYFGRTSFSAGTIYHLSSFPPDVSLFGENDYDSFGAAIAVGNLDGMAPNELLVGAYGFVQTFSQQGAVYVISGRSAWPGALQAGSLPGEREGRILGGGTSRLGWSLATGDTNGDGRDALLAGATLTDRPGDSMVGRVYLILPGDLYPPTSVDPRVWSAY